MHHLSPLMAFLDGGSGFSFADLLADRAGARLGRLATQDEGSARRVQEFLSAGIPLASVMPGVEDLPEGISQEQLEQELGGLKGEGFQRWESEIGRRVEALPPLD